MSLYSKDACPAFDANALWKFASDYWFIWGLVFVVIGGFVNFFGRVMIKPTVFFISFVVITFCELFLLYSLFLSHETATWVYWVILVICSVIGFTCSYYLVKSMKYGLAVVGGGSGAALALLICSTFSVQQPPVFWGIIVVSAMIFTVLTFKMSDQFMIFSTAMMGSYMLVRGVSFYAGGYPNEFEMMQELDSGAFQSIPKTFFVYLVFIFISLTGGIYYQWKQWK